MNWRPRKRRSWPPLAFGGDDPVFQEHLGSRLGLQQRQRHQVAVRRPLRQLQQDRALRAPRHQADLLAGVAAEHRPVVDQRHALAQAGRGQRRSAARDPAADDHDIEVPGVDRLVRQAAQRPSPGAAGGVDRVRRDRTIRAEEDRVAAALEAGQVVQREADLPLGERDLAGRLPRPVRAVRAELVRQGHAVDGEGEAAGRVRRRPVLRPDEDLVVAGDGDRHLGGRIGDRASKAVRQQVGRAHLGLELGIDHPAAVIVEVLGLDQDRRGSCGLAHGQLASHLGSGSSRERSAECHAGGFVARTRSAQTDWRPSDRMSGTTVIWSLPGKRRVVSCRDGY